jgi:methyltransferase (TIGR00027 family)
MNHILPSGFAEATAKMLVASSAAKLSVIRLASSPKMVSVYEAFDWMMPGQFQAFAHRKAFCELQVKNGIGTGATQILVLGAGYDMLCWRLALEFTNVCFFEIDHLPTSLLKAKGIKEMGPRNNLHLIAEDLSKRKLVDVMRTNHSWNPKAQTIIVAEGLLMYLPPIAVQELLEQCAEIASNKSRMVFTYLSAGINGRPDVGSWTKLVLWLLKASGEPWLWSINPQELDHFLEKTGWKNAPDMVGTCNKYGVEYLGVATK